MGSSHRNVPCPICGRLVAVRSATGEELARCTCGHVFCVAPLRAGQCPRHGERQDSECEGCGTALCARCVASSDGLHLCPACAAHRGTASPSPAAPLPEATPPVDVPPIADLPTPAGATAAPAEAHGGAPPLAEAPGFEDAASGGAGFSLEELAPPPGRASLPGAPESELAAGAAIPAIPALFENALAEQPPAPPPPPPPSEVAAPAAVPAAQTTCVEHRDVEAVTSCDGCGAPACSTCTFEFACDPVAEPSEESPDEAWGSVLLCPACATTPDMTVSRLRIVLFAAGCAASALSLLVGMPAWALGERTPESAAILATVTFPPALLSVTLTLAASDRRLHTPRWFWAPLAATGVALAAAAFLGLVAVVG